MTEAELELLQKYAGHLSGLTRSSCRVVDSRKQQVLGGGPDAFCRGGGCSNASCELYATYAYGCSEAGRWGGKYIYYCREGLVFVAASVTDDMGGLEGGLVLGPIVMGRLDDALADCRTPGAAEGLSRLENFSTRQVNDAAELMAAVLSPLSGAPYGPAISYRQEDILQAIYAERARLEQEPCPYPVDMEKRLQALIREGDKPGAQALLNDLLARIFLISNFDLDTSRIRVVELLTLLSRATIDAGADSAEIIWFNTECVKALRSCHTQDELGAWITGIMHRFINYTFDFSSLKHSDTVYKVIEYIRANYSQKITLDEIARHVHFSKTYLSRIFKEETGENISAYINRIRIDKAKLLLADKGISLVEVASLVGFEDQSYFTKVFKALTGTPPKRYQESRARF
ncbi:MAG: helix-turn-helix domain-containing protein [Oscillospiraceae bacterium]|jgi:two-component system response regulator YesN|nr:helix-turn-helix domain-containing protein [Oscillospiraceae bacterium]